MKKLLFKNFYLKFGANFLKVKSVIPEFVIYVDTTKPGSLQDIIQLPIRGSNMIIDWGDNITDTHTQTWPPALNNWVTHQYNTPGEYEIKITGLDWIYFNNQGDKAKLLDIRNWGTGQWASMERSFFGCFNVVGTFTDVPDLSNVTNMSVMFYLASKFNGDVSLWDVSNVIDMSYIFRNATIFNSDISQWNTQNVENMENMFRRAETFNSDISQWNTQNVTNMYGMFYESFAFNQDLSGWCVTEIGSYPNNFDIGASKWILSRPVWGTCS